ncbi:hypothetical protein [Devosia sp.]|uniref:hypothetical protein n=1 Tax=Devosia sp. TaxID=1871048 RepID=UPI0035B457FE
MKFSAVPDWDGQRLYCQQRIASAPHHGAASVNPRKIFDEQRFTDRSRLPDSTADRRDLYLLVTKVNGPRRNPREIGGRRGAIGADSLTNPP